MNGRHLAFIALIVIIGLIVTQVFFQQEVPPVEPEPEPTCDLALTHSQVKHLYLLGSLYPAELEDYVLDRFRDSEEMRCLTDYCESFGRFLMEDGYTAFPEPGLRERALALATEAGQPAEGPEVLQDMVAASLDLVQLGRIIRGFPAIIRGLHQGDRAAYEASSLGQLHLSLATPDTGLRVLHEQLMDAQRLQLTAFVDGYLDMLASRFQASS